MKYRDVDGAGVPIIGRQQPQQIHVQPIQWLMGGDSELSPDAQPTFTFDGHEFPRIQPQPTAMFLYLAYKARRGDEAAKLVLDTFTIGLNDAFGKAYWPVSNVIVPAAPIACEYCLALPDEIGLTYHVDGCPNKPVVAENSVDQPN